MTIPKHYIYVAIAAFLSIAVGLLVYIALSGDVVFDWNGTGDGSVSGRCEVENCHGMEIECGSNPPDVCTEIYMIGDKCLQYAQCGIVDGQCVQVENDDFTSCKECVENCIDHYGDDTEGLWGCEGECPPSSLE